MGQGAPGNWRFEAFRNVWPLAIKGGILTVSVESAYRKRYIEENRDRRLLLAWRTHGAAIRRVDLVVRTVRAGVSRGGQQWR